MTCTAGHQVVALDLSGFGLSGSLPSSLGQLTHLAVLNLADNPSLTGPLPASWQLSQLLLLNVLVSQNTTSRIRGITRRVSAGKHPTCLPGPAARCSMSCTFPHHARPC